MGRKIADFEINKMVLQKADSSIYQVRDLINDENVFLKMLKSEYPSLEDLSKIRDEYEKLNSVTSNNVIKPLELKKYKNTLLMVMESTSGVSLREFMETELIQLDSFFKIAIGIANALYDVHKKAIILKEITPEFIMIDPKTLAIKLIDLGNASMSGEGYLSRMKLVPQLLNYISPELTGRMNRSVDVRTDIYTLGIILYELMAGRLPFQNQDPMEIIHSHLVQTPVIPLQFNKEFPKQISDIIMKCLSKIPEERYQSVFGLKNDIETCQEQLQTLGKVDSSFTLGQFDLHETFHIPEKLYGREEELKLIQEAFKRTCEGKKEWVLIFGTLGQGKTALAKEVIKFAMETDCNVVSGKFETSQHQIPFSGLILALTELMHNLLKEKEEVLAGYRQELLTELGANAQVLIDYIPELEFIIGKQPTVQKLSGEEAKNRLLQVLIQFLQVFAKKEHPLFIFLDDFQLADAGTLNCIKGFLVDKRLTHLLIMCACRSQDHEREALKSVIVETRDQHGTVLEIELTPLTLEETCQILSDTLHSTDDQKAAIRALSEILYNKTNGNPFFLHQLLEKLYEEGFIQYDFESKSWEWELDKLQKLELSENVIDLMLSKIKQFPLDSQSILSFASIIGQKFSINLLVKASKLSYRDVLTRLLPAIKSEMIISEQQSKNQLINLLNNEDPHIDQDMERMNLTFQFVNSRIHQAADNISSKDDKLSHHYVIGSLLLQDWDQQHSDKDDLLFEIVSHLNQATHLLQSEKDRMQLAKLNLDACLRAKNLVAHSLAYEVSCMARVLLADNAWETDYKLIYDIYIESIDCAYFQKKVDEAELLFNEIVSHAKTRLDKGRVYLIKMTFSNTFSEYEKVIEMGRVCASLFGIKIPINPSAIDILYNYYKVKKATGKRKVEDLEFLPEMHDPEHIFLMQLLFLIMTAGFVYNKHILAFGACTAMQIGLKHGNCPSSPSIYIAYGLIVQGLFKDYKGSFAFAEVARKLADKYAENSVRCRVYFIAGILINHWTLPLKKSDEYIVKSLEFGKLSGETFYMSYVIPFNGFGDGTYLVDIPNSYRRMQLYSDIPYAAKNYQAIHSLQLRMQILHKLADPSFRGLSLSDEKFNDDAFFEEIRTNSQFKAVHQGYVTYKSMVLFYFGHFKQGLELIDESHATREAVYHFITHRDQIFFHSLNLCGACEGASKWERHKYFKLLKKDFKLMRIWNGYCAANNLHRLMIMEAELARVKGKYNKALSLYDDAIKHANENNFISEAGLANELAAKLYLKLGKTSLAKTYMQEAHYAYYRWGALSKVSQLEELYPQLLEIKAKNDDTNKTDTFDMAAVLHASAVLSKEIYLDKLLNEVLKVLIVEAGADKAIFLMEDEGRWIVQGEKLANQEISQVLLGLPFETQSDRLSVPLINYVLRTKEKVIINDVAIEGMFSSDTYLNVHHVKAVLCIPVIYQGKMSAILYLENTASKDVFSSEKIHILEMLSAQIATSIENSTLYGRLEKYNRNLERKVEERTLEIQQKNQDLASTLEELRNTQNHLVESEKLAALGMLISGITHEVNTPLGAVKASALNAKEASKSILQNFADFMSTLDQQKMEIFTKVIKIAASLPMEPLSSREERQIKKSILEKFKEKQFPNAFEVVDILIDMGVYEDISDLLYPIRDELLPLLGFAYNFASIIKNNQNLGHAVERASKIILALKAYVHQDRSEALKSANIIENLESVLTLYQHQLKKNVILEKRYDEIPMIPCRANDLNQVWNNLIHNSLQAMDNQGTLEIDIFQENGYVVIRITDSGEGIPDDVKSRIFTPFFTTKSRGEGSGLGLSISKKIIEAHNGEISFVSRPGQTIFSVKIPVNLKEEVPILAMPAGENEQESSQGVSP